MECSICIYVKQKQLYPILVVVQMERAVDAVERKRLVVNGIVADVVPA